MRDADNQRRDGGGPRDARHGGARAPGGRPQPRSLRATQRRQRGGGGRQRERAHGGRRRGAGPGGRGGGDIADRQLRRRRARQDSATAGGRRDPTGRPRRRGWGLGAVEAWAARVGSAASPQAVRHARSQSHSVLVATNTHAHARTHAHAHTHTHTHTRARANTHTHTHTTHTPPQSHSCTHKNSRCATLWTLNTKYPSWGEPRRGAAAAGARAGGCCRGEGAAARARGLLCGPAPRPVAPLGGGGGWGRTLAAGRQGGARRRRSPVRHAHTPPPPPRGPPRPAPQGTALGRTP
jgi:hypothetical protein